MKILAFACVLFEEICAVVMPGFEPLFVSMAPLRNERIFNSTS